MVPHRMFRYSSCFVLGVLSFVPLLAQIEGPVKISTGQVSGTEPEDGVVALQRDSVCGSAGGRSALEGSATAGRLGRRAGIHRIWSELHGDGPGTRRRHSVRGLSLYKCLDRGEVSRGKAPGIRLDLWRRIHRRLRL